MWRSLYNLMIYIFVNECYTLLRLISFVQIVVKNDNTVYKTYNTQNDIETKTSDFLLLIYSFNNYNFTCIHMTYTYNAHIHMTYTYTVHIYMPYTYNTHIHV